MHIIRVGAVLYFESLFFIWTSIFHELPNLSGDSLYPHSTSIVDHFDVNKCKRQCDWNSGDFVFLKF